MTFKYAFLITLFFITGNVSAAPTCFDLKTECLEPGGTRYFEGHPITLDCWRKIVTYECRVNSDNNCQQLEENAQDETLKYPIEQCNEIEDIDYTENAFSDFDFNEIGSGSLFSDMSGTYDICDEEAQPIQKKICENIPHITITDDPYPRCQKHISPGGIEDCLIGRIQIPSNRGDGYGKISIPKNRGSRVVFNNSKHGYCYVTIFNEVTGQHVISPRTRLNNNMYIELPFSKTQDQTFSFVVHRTDGCSCEYAGSLHVYFNYLRKIPKIEWKEELCKDV